MNLLDDSTNRAPLSQMPLPKRILHIGKYFPPHRGGMETFLRDLMIEQQEAGLEVQALVHTTDRSWISRDEYHQTGLCELRITRVARWFTVAFTPFSPTFYCVLERNLRSFRPDIIHLHLPNTSAFWCLISLAARRIPWVIHWHSDVIASKHKSSLRLLYQVYKIPERLLLTRAKRIVATSEAYLNSSVPLRNFQDKCTVVPLAIRDTSNKALSECAIKEAHRFTNQNSLKILTVCRLTYYKGLVFLIEALAHAPDVTLTLVGDGEEKAALLERSREIGVRNRIHFTSDCSDERLEHDYSNHHLFCLPSIERTEAFGVVLLEAMRAGLPCLVTDVPGSGMKWVVDAPRCGFCVPPADSLALAHAMNELHANRTKLIEAGQKSKIRYHREFALAGCANRLSTIYKGAIGGTKKYEH